MLLHLATAENLGLQFADSDNCLFKHCLTVHSMVSQLQGTAAYVQTVVRDAGVPHQKHPLQPSYLMPCWWLPVGTLPNL